jgi:hypothetical protein
VIETRHSQNENVLRGEALRVEVEELARALARRINSEAGERREELREAAVGVLRDEVEFAEPEMREDALASAVMPAGPTANPFAIGIPLLLAGAPMIILFPPVGLVLLAAAAGVVVWGIATVMFGPAARRRGT